MFIKDLAFSVAKPRQAERSVAAAEHKRVCDPLTSNINTMKHLSKWELQEWSAMAMLMVGTLLVMLGFWCPPRGAIHESVLWFFGQCLVYAGSVLGVASYISVRR